MAALLGAGAASERTPLLAESGRAVADNEVYLHEAAQALIGWIRAGSRGTPPRQEDPRSELAAQLYAHHLTSSSPVAGTVRERLVQQQESDRIRERLRIAIQGLLDSGVGGGGSNESDSEQIIWMTCLVGRESPDYRLSAIDLLLPPFWPDGSPFLCHPLLRLVIKDTWTRGLDIPVPDGRPSSVTGPRALRSLRRTITPRRAHVLKLLSLLVLIALTLTLALRPRDWIFPEYATSQSRPAAIEVVYSIWTIGSVVQALPSLGSSLLLLPSFIAPILAVFGGPSFSALALTIPFLTVHLISTASPSVVYLFPSLLPPALLLRRAFSRSLSASRLIVPLLLLVFAVFSLAMNGDLFRGLIDFSRLYAVPVTTPTEPGVAPHETRLWLFVTLVGLLVMLLVLLAARTAERSGPEEVMNADPWVQEYGSAVAIESRAALAKVVRDELDSPSIIVPFNLIAVPLDIALVMFRLRHLPGQDLARRLRTIRGVLQAITTGPFCLLVSMIDRQNGLE